MRRGRGRALAAIVIATISITGLLTAISPTVRSTDRGFLVLETRSGSELRPAVRPANRGPDVSIPVGLVPTKMAFDPSNAQLYVADDGGSSASDSVSVINTTTNLVVANITVGGNPNAVTYDPLNQRVYVSNSGASGDYAGANTVSVIDTATEAVIATAPVGGGPLGSVLDPDNGDLYVGNWGTANITVLSTVTDSSVANISVEGQGGPSEAVWDPADGEVYFDEWSGPLTGNLSVIDPNNNSLVGSLPMGPLGVGVTYDPANNEILGVSGSGVSVTIYNGSTDAYVSNFTVRCCAGGATYDPVTDAALILNTASGLVQVVSNSTDQIVQNLSAPGYIQGFAVDTLNGDIYYSDTTNDTVGVIGPPPPLESATITPGVSNVTAGGEVSLLAVPVCAGGSCPGGASFAWNLTNSLGTLNTSTGPAVNFEAGAEPGTVGVIVNISLDGVLRESAPALITIAVPVLVGARILPSSATIVVGARLNLSAFASCSPSPCPNSDISFQWTTNNTLGTLNSSAGPSVSFLAGETAGATQLTVTAHLAESSESAQANLTLTALPSSPKTGNSTTGFLGLPGVDGYLLIGGLVAIAAIAGVLGIRRSRKPRTPPEPGQTPGSK